MTGHIVQGVAFRGGKNDGRFANIAFALPFSVKTLIVADGIQYRIIDGPMARNIEETQTAIEYGMIVLEEVES